MAEWNPEPDFADLYEHDGDCGGSFCPECKCCVHTEVGTACGCLSRECQCSPNFGEAFTRVIAEGEKVRIFAGPASPAADTEED